MWYFVVFFTVLGVALSKTIPDEDLPILGIVGGNTALPKQFPYQVSLEYSDRHKCGGSIISRTMILTAAHCTDGRTAEMIEIRVGSTQREFGGQLLKIKDYTNHPLYNKDSSDYDVAVIELRKSLKFSNYVKPIKLVNSYQRLSATKGIVSGWGQLSENNYLLPRDLQFVELPIWSDRKCRALMKITDRMFCAGYSRGGKDTCQSDSGGPFVAKGVLIGVVTWGNGCGRPNSPGVYINVAHVRKWLKKVAHV